MKRMLLALMAFLLLVALLVIISVYTSPMIASASFTIAFLCVMGGIVAACTSKEPRRIYWRAFALFAAIYFLLTVLIGDTWSIAGAVMDVGSRTPKPIFLTSYLLAWTHDLVGQVPPTSDGINVSAMQILNATADRPPPELGNSDYDSLMIAGHSIFTIYCGLFGGWISSGLARNAPNRASPT